MIEETKAEASAPVPDTGYPVEPLQIVHAAATYESFAPLNYRDQKKFMKNLPLLFAHFQSINKPHPMIATRDTFDRQFAAFTSSVFADWGADLWNNVLVAGGSGKSLRINILRQVFTAFAFFAQSWHACFLRIRVLLACHLAR